MLAPTAPVRFELCKPYMVGQQVFAEARHAPRLKPRPPSSGRSRRTRRSSGPRSTSGTRRTPGTSSRSRAGRCRCGTRACSTSTTRCARPPACSTCRTWACSRRPGPHAEEFLDLVLTNYVRWYAPGESFYSYLLDQDGNVIDDLLVYRRAKDNFQIVVNASNADKDWAWLNAVNNGEVLLDRNRPELKVLRPATLRNLKDPSSGAGHARRPRAARARRRCASCRA